MNEARRLKAEAFARQVMAEPALREGLEALVEGLEWVAFQKWRAAPDGRGWSQIAGELAALRAMSATIRAAGAEAGNQEGSENVTSGSGGSGSGERKEQRRRRGR